MTSKALYIATPCYGGQASALYMRSLLALKAACGARKLALQVDLGGGDALIGRARAAMTARFLASGAGHLLFIDADIGFAPDDVFRLMDARKDVIGGVYPRKRQIAGTPAALEFDALPDTDLSVDPTRVAAVGTGFLLVSRDAARRVGAAHPELVAGLADLQNGQAAKAAMIFDSLIEPGTGRYLSDYQAFCHRWRALGGAVWADRGCALTHIGEIAHAMIRG